MRCPCAIREDDKFYYCATNSSRDINDDEGLEGVSFIIRTWVDDDVYNVFCFSIFRVIDTSPSLAKSAIMKVNSLY